MIAESEAKISTSNVPEFSVSDLAFTLKKTLEDNFSHIRVRGELSRVSIPASGHLYTSLKDENAVIDAVCWKGNLQKLGVRPEEGLEVICTGRVSSYAKSSKYQLIIESMELAGEGALLKLLEERKNKLAAEGLFAAECKKPIPLLPRSIGVVTSPTGAVIRDILHRLSDRFPRPVLVWPVKVQGEGSAEDIAVAINGFNRLPADGSVQRPDILIVARGGGSLEDLMAFNEENVVRAVAASDIPVISAVGHETDTTLCDYAADLRAPTPTGAAEMAVPRRAELLAQIKDDEGRLLSAMTRMMSDYSYRLETQAHALGDPARLTEAKAQTLDHLSDKMERIFDSYLAAKQNRLTASAARLRSPQERLNEAQKMLRYHGARLSELRSKITQHQEQKLSNLSQMLEVLSFKSVLQRGYTVVRDADGQIVSDGAVLKDRQGIEIQFKDDIRKTASIGADGRTTTPPKPTKAKKSARKTDDNQTSLF